MGDLVVKSNRDPCFSPVKYFQQSLGKREGDCSSLSGISFGIMSAKLKKDISDCPSDLHSCIIRGCKSDFTFLEQSPLSSPLGTQRPSPLCLIRAHRSDSPFLQELHVRTLSCDEQFPALQEFPISFFPL